MAKRKADVEPNDSAAPVRRSGRNRPDEPEVNTLEQSKAIATVTKPKVDRPNVKKVKSAKGGGNLEVGATNSSRDIS